MIKSLKKKQGGFTLIELMVVIVIIGILVAIALPNFIGAQDRAKISSVKANMHTFQTIVETYGVDFGGSYAANVTKLNTAATDTTQGTSAYWKDFSNPFTSQSGKDKSYGDAAAPIKADSSITSLTSGIVAYAVDGTTPTKYYIYGGGKKSNVSVRDKGKAFFLTNS